MTDKTFSEAVWCGYVNQCANNTDGKHPEEQKAVKTFVEKTIKKLGCPNQDEVHDVVDNYNDYDLSPVAATIPTMVSGYMHDERRKFDLPSVDPSTARASIGVRAVDRKVKDGTIRFGKNAGETYHSVIEAHEEIYVKNFTKAFKK